MIRIKAAQAEQAVRMYCNNESSRDNLDEILSRLLTEEIRMSLFTEKHNGQTVVQTAAERAHSRVIRRILLSVGPANRIKLIQVRRLST